MINNKKVYDCFLFYKEVEMLKLRLNSLQDYVDVFVISEATQTHSGEPCVPMSLAILDLFDKPIRDKIIVTQTVFPQHLTEPFEREHYQRDDMLQFITSNSGADAPSPDDILLLSDVDEIPNLKLYTGEEGVFNQKFYYYFLNMRHAHKWWAGTTAIYAKNCKSFRKLREEHWNRERLPFHGGWHYSMMGSVKLLQEKIKAFAHQEFNKEELLKEETLLKKIKERKDIFDRNFEKPFTLEPLDGSDWLLEHKDEYKDWVKPIKISLGMIVKNEEEILVKTLEAVRPIVDEYCIVDTGSTDKTHDIIKRYQPEVIEIPFEDFVTTKNKALEHCNGEYVLWMDADEILYKGHQNLLDWVNKDVEAVNCKITEGDANDYSITTCVYDRVRMWKNNGKWKFYGPGVHEVIVGENVTAVDDPNILVRHEHLKSDKAQTAKDRFLFYIELLNNFIKDNPNDTRAWFYLGRTYMDINERLMAISCFLKYLSIPGNTFRDEKFDAAYNIAKCYKEEGEYDKAISWCYKSLQYDYRRSEAYCVLGEIFFIKKD